MEEEPGPGEGGQSSGEVGDNIAVDEELKVETMKMNELKYELRSRNHLVSGNKHTLIARLNEVLSKEKEEKAISATKRVKVSYNTRKDNVWDPVDYQVEHMVGGASAALRSHRTEVSKEEEMAKRIVIHPEIKTDHKADLISATGLLRAVLAERQNEVNAGLMAENIMAAMMSEDNPFTDFPRNTQKNFVLEIVEFATAHCRDAICTILVLTTTNETEVDEDVTIKTAFKFMMIACSVNPGNNSSFFKTMGIFLKSCGLTDKGLNVLSKLGVCEGPSAVSSAKDVLASIDDTLLYEQAVHGNPVLVFDNCDFFLKSTLHHFTLPIYMFFAEGPDTTNLPTNNGVSVDEAVKFFRPSILALNFEENASYRKSFLNLACNVWGRLVHDKVPGLAFMGKVFKEHYDHPQSKTAAQRTIVHADSAINENEMSHPGIIRILSSCQNTYLNMLVNAQPREEQEELRESIKIVKSKESSIGERAEADNKLETAAKKFGRLQTFGDGATVQKVEDALDIQKNSVTSIEALRYILPPELGDLHTLMTKHGQDITHLVNSLSNSRDRLTLSYFYNRLMGKYRVYVTPEDIKKKGNFECTSNFFLTIGKQFIIQAVESFKNEMDIDGVVFEESLDGGRCFFKMFLKSRKIKLFWEGEEEPGDFDDCAKYSRDMIARCSISLMLKRAWHEGDAMARRSIYKVLCLYNINHRENMRSNYAQLILFNLVDYERRSSRDKTRLDQSFTCNTTGFPGDNIPMDMEMEHHVRDATNNFKSLRSNLEVMRMVKALKSQNSIKRMQDHILDSINLGRLKSGGGASTHSVFR